jgi:hypothetical protein
MSRVATKMEDNYILVMRLIKNELYSSVGIATGYWFDGQSSIAGRGKTPDPTGRTLLPRNIIFLVLISVRG